MNKAKKLESAQAKINNIFKKLCEEGVQVRAVINEHKHSGECKTYGVFYPQVKLTLIEDYYGKKN